MKCALAQILWVLLPNDTCSDLRNCDFWLCRFSLNHCLIQESKAQYFLFILHVSHLSCIVVCIHNNPNYICKQNRKKTFNDGYRICRRKPEGGASLIFCKFFHRTKKLTKYIRSKNISPLRKGWCTREFQIRQLFYL